MANRLNILAFDTSSEVCTVALLQTQAEGESLVTLDHRHAPKQHTQLILPMIDGVLSNAGIAISDLSAIAVGVGPGSFTGCRLAVSVAQALGLAHHLPLIPVSSMAAMAMAAYLSEGHQWVLVSLDARTEQVYAAGYHITSENEYNCIIPEQIYPVNAFTWPEQPLWVGVGDGFKEGDSPDVVMSTIFPTGLAVAKLGLILYLQGVTVSPAALEPQYLRGVHVTKSINNGKVDN